VFGGSNVSWIGSKLGDLAPYFEYFDLVSLFEIWLNGELDLRVVKLVRTTVVSAYSNFWGRMVWEGKRCPIELTFG
jgi:hypothetical protein